MLLDFDDFGCIDPLKLFSILILSYPSASSGRGILLKPAPGANRADEEEGQEQDTEKGGRVVGKKGSDGVNSGGRGIGSEGVKAGGKNPTSPPLLPLLAASRDLR